MRAGLFLALLISACGEISQTSGSSPASAGSYGWNGTAGGSCSDGGAQVTAVHVATGCTGNLETVQACTGLCVAKITAVSGPHQAYGIDVTEVTQGQYSAWLATNPALPPSTDKTCGSVTSYVQHGNRYSGPGPNQYPVVNVDWCSAYAYCLGVGKRLCGAIAGGSVSGGDGYMDATTSQWYRACSSGGTNTYPYGNTYESDFCSGADSRTSWVPVGSLGNCVTSETGYAGVYDLSGNVDEWENGCFTIDNWIHCNMRGGSFREPYYYLACDAVSEALSSYTEDNVGFRCCSN